MMEINYLPLATNTFISIPSSIVSEYDKNLISRSKVWQFSIFYVVCRLLHATASFFQLTKKVITAIQQLENPPQKIKIYK